MRNWKKKLVSALFGGAVLATAGAFVACGGSGESSSEGMADGWTVESIYEKVQYLGYEGELSQLLAIIQSKGDFTEEQINDWRKGDRSQDVNFERIHIKEAYVNSEGDFILVLNGDKQINLGRIWENLSGIEPAPDEPVTPEGGKVTRDAWRKGISMALEATNVSVQMKYQVVGYSGREVQAEGNMRFADNKVYQYFLYKLDGTEKTYEQYYAQLEGGNYCYERDEETGEWSRYETDYDGYNAGVRTEDMIEPLLEKYDEFGYDQENGGYYCAQLWVELDGETVPFYNTYLKFDQYLGSVSFEMPCYMDGEVVGSMPVEILFWNYGSTEVTLPEVDGEKIPEDSFETSEGVPNPDIGETPEVAEGELEYKLLGASYAVVGIGGYKGDELIIPATYNGYPVTQISANAFSGCTDITGVILPETVIEIEKRAFYNCIELTEITLPASLDVVRPDAFYGCNNLKNVYYQGILETWCGILFDDKESQPLSFGGNLYIGQNRLQNAEGSGNLYIDNVLVEKLAIPYSVTKIGDYAFLGRNCLKSVTIPKGVVSIGDYALSECNGLTSVMIPDSVNTLGHGVFKECGNLSGVNMSQNLVSMGERVFKDCRNLVSIELPDGLTSIGASTFKGCVNLLNVSLPAGMTSIGNSSFAGCERLENVILPDDLTSIGANAFLECRSLTEIAIPENVGSIGLQAFSSCDNLRTVTFLSRKPPQIGSDVFCYTWDAEDFKVYVPADSLELYRAVNVKLWQDSLVNANKIYAIGETPEVAEGELEYKLSGNSYAVVGIGGYKGDELIIPATYNGYPVTRIEASAFENNDTLLTVGSEGTIDSVGYNAFTNCTKLEKVNISVRNFEGYTFLNCTKLRVVQMFGKIDYVGEGCFGECYSLQEVYMQYAPTSIGYCPFLNCSSLYNIGIENEGAYKTVEGVLYSGDQSELITYPAAKEDTQFTIPSNTSMISDSAFYGVKHLVTVELPNGVNGLHIGSSAFMASSVEELLANWDWRSRGFRIEAMSMAFYNSAIRTVNVPFSQVEPETFARCKNLQSLIIGEEVWYSGWKTAFGEGTPLATVYYMGTQESWNSNGLNTMIQETAATVCYYSETKPADANGDYWHFDVDGVTPVFWNWTQKY